MGEAATVLRRALEEAAAGLLYSSEGDHPFEYVELAAPAEPLTPERFRALVGAPEGARVEEVPLRRFLQQHTDAADPHDDRAQALRPRYERLEALISTHLDGVRVYRIGEVRIDCWIVGRAPGGALAGLRTVAIET